MGSGPSSPMGASASTHAQAFTNTEYTRMIMDELLNYMVKQLSVRDLLHMSKESECKKYVLFKANSIYQYFYELRVFPTKDARGLLTFRRIEDLVNPKGEQEKERQSLCLIVAYFYTRIFQIYGALALTLIDDMNVMTSSGLMTTFERGTDLRKYTPGYYEERISQIPYRRGGARELVDSTPLSSTISLKNFEWIRSFLTPETSATGYKTRYIGSGEDRGTVYLKIEDSLKDADKKPIYGNPPPITYQYAIFSITVPNVNQYNTLELYTRITPDEIKVKLGKLIFKNTAGETIVVTKFDRIDFYIERTIINGKQTYMIKDKPITDVPAFMADLLSTIIIYLKSTIKEKKETIYERGDVRSERDRSEYGDRGDRGTISRKSEEGITSHLKVEEMINNLTTRRPLGHCIARALQLLKTEPFVNQPGISQICSVAFDGKGTERIGLPKSGKPLSDNPGLFALANLFYDTIIIGSPNLIIGKNTIDGQPSTFQQYITFMTTLSKQYTIGDKPLTPQEMEEKGLSGIINERDKKACPTANEIPLTPQTTSKVHAIVKSMFQMQVEHAAKCSTIISMLFTITTDPTTKKPIMFKLNNNLINKGFPELERINREARNILVAYYTNCENKYWDGMKFVLTDQKEKIQADAQTKAKAAALQAQIIASKENSNRARAEYERKKAKAEEDAKIKDIYARAALSRAEAEREIAAKAAKKQEIVTGKLPVVGKPPVAERPRVAFRP